MRRSRPDLGELDLASEMEATLREVRASLKTIAREMKARGLRQDEPIPADLEAPCASSTIGGRNSPRRPSMSSLNGNRATLGLATRPESEPAATHRPFLS